MLPLGAATFPSGLELAVGLGSVALLFLASRLQAARSRRALRALAGRLEAGRVRADASLLGDTDGFEMRGRRNGRELAFRIERRDGPGGRGRYGVWRVSVPCCVSLELVLERRSFADRLGELLLGGDRAAYDAQRRGRGVSSREQRREVEAVVRAAFESCDLERLTLRHGLLVGERLLGGFNSDLPELELVFRALERVAAELERAPLTLEVPAATAPAAFAWTGGSGELRCPYCRDAADPRAPDAVVCATCGTLHHAECFAELGRCTLLGCEGERAARLRS